MRRPVDRAIRRWASRLTYWSSQRSPLLPDGLPETLGLMLNLSPNLRPPRPAGSRSSASAHLSPTSLSPAPGSRPPASPSSHLTSRCSPGRSMPTGLPAPTRTFGPPAARTRSLRGSASAPESRWPMGAGPRRASFASPDAGDASDWSHKPDSPRSSAAEIAGWRARSWHYGPDWTSRRAGRARRRFRRWRHSMPHWRSSSPMRAPRRCEGASRSSQSGASRPCARPGQL